MNIITDLATLQDVWTSISTKWIGPLVFIIIGALSLKFLLNRQWSQFVSFLGIGVMVAVIIYIAPSMFGQDSQLVNSVGTTVKQIN
ncbi:hypothetical protein [Bifidobacterium porcinum]|uniref:hypothetical protein n=1 Tax=Bifidobacterium porcinum TaxID=212365 RepID=UPI00052A032B|nr:hypothetical protein [Bifidobacterium porcinum]